MANPLMVDLWLGHESLVDKLGWQVYRMLGRHEYVSSLVVNGEWQLHAHPVGWRLATDIQNITLDRNRVKDTWIWDGAPSENFEFRVAYHQVRPRYDTMSQIEFIWFKGVAHKMQLHMYKTLKGRLLTLNRLIRFGIQVPNQWCILCGQEEESISHLYFSCSFTWEIWSNQRVIMKIPIVVLQVIRAVEFRWISCLLIVPGAPGVSYVDGVGKLSGAKIFEHLLIGADISIHPWHLKQIKPHQIEGFSILVKNLLADPPGGCILAHAPGT